MVDYAKKFDISKQTVEKWRSEEIFLKGNNKTLIILIPGWSAVTRQVFPLAKKLQFTRLYYDRQVQKTS